MAYEKQTFIDNQTVLTAAMLEHIENGIVAVEEAIDASKIQKNEINLSAYPTYNTLIGETAGTWGSGSDRFTYFVPVGDAEKIDLTANSVNYAIVALLKTDAHASGTEPDYATGGFRMIVDAGVTVSLIVPDDCRYIAIAGVIKGNERTPESVVFYSTESENQLPPIGLHTMPENDGVLNCIKRCRQMTDIKWTPMLDIPRWSKVAGGSTASGGNDVREDVFKAGVEYTGLPYARADRGAGDYGYSNFFVGFNIPFSAFATAIREQYSVVKDSVFSLANKSACVYGVVCSTLACYAYNLSSYVGTSTMPNVSGIEKISDIIVDGAAMDASLIKLGDMLLKPGDHCAVITDIVTDASGEVIAIEVSEATTTGNGNLDRQGTQFGGLCRRKGWGPDDFFAHWKDYGLYRYDKIAGVPYTPDVYVNVGDELNMMPQLDYACLPYMGEGFKYKAGSVANSAIVVGMEGYDYLRVMKDGEYFGDPIAINGERYVDAGFAEAGSYSAYLCNMSGSAETNRSGACHWTVV